jgi:hypothetical protein
MERRRHLELAVDPLLAQDRHLGARAPEHVRRRNILLRVERQPGEQSWITGVARTFMLFPRALRIVTQRLHVQRRLRPGPAQFRARRREQ